ncbi:HPP family protein [Candidatus Microthrix sp.]|uniref:HPP family protein n=1 Tax=Candidatus Neomicrothrix sp. TaxID=2719034 RepID=UPI0025929768|nr:HPP family protein [Candidatus Microthrix sp.]HMS46994.1 HPP family protein [Candidatus Microthrix sp.]
MSEPTREQTGADHPTPKGSGDLASKSPRSGPIGGDISAIVEGFGTRFRIPVLVSRHSQTSVMGLFALVNGVLSIALMSMAAVVTGQAFIFPSLGPTAFLLFYTPTLPAACPRNTIFGHAIGVAAGYLALVIFGLTEAAPALATEVTWPRVGAAAVSLGLTSGFMVWFKVPHPPAGATTLIVSLGILKTPAQLTVLMIAVVLMVGQGMVINRLAGIDYPSWAPRRPA